MTPWNPACASPWRTSTRCITLHRTGSGTIGFSIYVTLMGNYNKTYGSLGAIIVLLLWLYFMAYAVLFGAAMNAELERQTERDTTAGAERPMGERGAYAADTVGPTRKEL